MNKTTNIILIVISVILVIGLFVGFGKDKPRDEANFGYGGYNELGIDGVTNSSTTVASSTSTQVFSVNWGRTIAMIGNTDGTNAVYCKLSAASTTVALYEGIVIKSGGSFTIGVDNLWKGEVWCIAAASPVVVSTIEK